MLDKIAKNNKIMSLISIATLVVICYFVFFRKKDDKPAVNAEK